MEPNKKEREISRDETYTKTWKEKGVSVAFQKEESFHDPGLSTIKKAFCLCQGSVEYLQLA